MTVWSQQGNVFAPITMINDERGAPLAREAMMRDFVR